MIIQQQQQTEYLLVPAVAAEAPRLYWLVHRREDLFVGCISIRLFVCLFVCIFVCWFSFFSPSVCAKAQIQTRVFLCHLNPVIDNLTWWRWRWRLLRRVEGWSTSVSWEILYTLERKYRNSENLKSSWRTQKYNIWIRDTWCWFKRWTLPECMTVGPPVRVTTKPTLPLKTIISRQSF